MVPIVIGGPATRPVAAVGLVTPRSARWLALVVAILLLLTGPAGAADYRPALWRVVNAGAPSHLFGSVHLGTGDLYPLPAPVESAFRAAAVLAVEIDLESIDPAEQSAVIERTGLYPVGEDLTTRGDEALLLSLDATCARLALPCTALHRYRPWLTSLTLAMRTLERAGFDAANGVDRHLIARARDRARVVSLETLGEQLDYFGSLDEQRQIDYLRETLEELDDATGVVIALYTAWRAGDVASVDRLVNVELRASTVPGLYEAMMVDRNRRMAERVDALLREGTGVFVVVGAGHLAGQHSLVVELVRRGWQIERVNY